MKRWDKTLNLLPKWSTFSHFSFITHRHNQVQHLDYLPAESCSLASSAMAAVQSEQHSHNLTMIPPLLTFSQLEDAFLQRESQRSAKRFLHQGTTEDVLLSSEQRCLTMSEFTQRPLKRRPLVFSPSIPFVLNKRPEFPQHSQTFSCFYTDIVSDRCSASADINSTVSESLHEDGASLIFRLKKLLGRVAKCFYRKQQRSPAAMTPLWVIVPLAFSIIELACGYQ